ncbi:MAG: hypothetical protein IIC90_05940 [Chloroflexi bacterium]|nr:hypothetical protein [Chloroflexota bacterium]
MGRGLRIAGFGALVGIGIATLAGCSDGPVAVPETPTTAPPLVATPTAVSATGDPSVSVRNAVIACREKNGELLRSLVAGEVTDEEIEALFERGVDVRLRGHTDPPREGGRASVTVFLTITRLTVVDDVEREWELERGDDGVWRFAELPDCY